MYPGNYLHFLFLFMRLRKGAEDQESRLGRIVQIAERLRLALIMVIFSLGVGTAGFMLIENYPLLDAWYMSVITLASVGFGEVHPLSDAGRLFTSFLILFNVGLFAYAISTIISIVAEGGFNRLINDFRMEQRINALEGHTIVCGFGRHATELAQELAKQNIPFVIVEKNPDKIDLLRERTGYLYVEGDATHDIILEASGIRRAAVLIITLPDDADNLFVVMSARQINPALRIISRAGNEADERKIRRAGANHTVVPERLGGFYMATLVNKPDLVEFFTLLSNMGLGKVVFEEVPVSRLAADFQNKTIAESGISQAGKVQLIAVRSPEGRYELNPATETRLLSNWHIVVFGSPEQMILFRTNVLRAED